MTHAHITSPKLECDDRRARRNAFILSLAQALYFIGSSIQLILGGLVGYMLASDKSLATLPMAFIMLGTLITTVPASMFMRRVGRRTGFQFGALLGLASASLAILAIYQLSFALFCVAMLFSGGYQAFAQYYRFAAADTASAAFRPKAISWVLAGGLIAAIAGPQLVIYTRDALTPVMYAGSFVASAGAAILALGILALVDIPNTPQASKDGGAPRPLREIFKQVKLRIAIFTGMVSYASMTFVMTATPLAMVGYNHSVNSAALAIQWHVLAMFAPSFVTGHLIERFGRERVVFAGFMLLAGAGLVAVSGQAAWQFNAAMIFLGLGWNFGYIGSTTMVTDCHRPEERNKVQAANEFMVFGLVAMASFSSGKVLNDMGWPTVVISYMPLVALAAGLVLMLSVRGVTWGAGASRP